MPGPSLALTHFSQNKIQRYAGLPKGKPLFGSLTYGAGGMVGGLLSGPIWQHYGASVLYSCSAVVALLGLLLILWKQNMSGIK